MAKSSQALKFFRVNGLPTSDATVGGIYFDKSTSTISIATGATTFEKYSGAIRDASFSNNVLTITKADDSTITLDFSDVASATNVNSLLGGLRTDVNNLQTATGIADGATAPAWGTGMNYLSSSEATLKAGIEKLDAQAKANADAASTATTNAATAQSTADSKIASVSGETAIESGSEDYIAVSASTDDANKAVTLSSTLKVQGVSGAGESAKGLAEASDVKSYVDTAVSTEETNRNTAIANAFAGYDASSNTAGKVLASGETISGNASSNLLVSAAQVVAYASGVVGAMHFIGTAVAADDKDAEKTYQEITFASGVVGYIEKDSYTAASGDIVLFGTKEYVYNGSAWALFGDEGTYATKAQLEGLDLSGDNAKSDAVHGVTVQVEQTDGQISKPVVAIAAAVLATSGDGSENLATGKQVFDAIAAVKGTLETGDYTTIEALSDAVKSVAGNVGTPDTGKTIQQEIDALETLAGTPDTGKSLQDEIDDLETAVGVKAVTGDDPVAATGLYKYVDDSISTFKTNVTGTPDSGKTLQGEIDNIESFTGRAAGFATSAQGGYADSAIQEIKLNNSELTVSGDNGAKSVSFTAVTHFAGKTGDITVDSDSTFNGTVNFAVSDGGELSGTVYGLASAAYVTTTSLESTMDTKDTAVKSAVVGTASDTWSDTADAEVHTVCAAKNYADSLWMWDSWATA